jgi:hypothetical protein
METRKAGARVRSQLSVTHNGGFGMEGQHVENLFRRYKGQVVSIKTLSGGIYEGHITEITNSYISLVDRGKADPAKVFLFFDSIESMTVVEAQDT